MQIIKSLSKSKVVRVLGLALALASIISFQHPVSADVGSGDSVLSVVVYNGDPVADVRVSGATVLVIGGADNGLTTTTDNSGIAIFHVHQGDFTVRVSHPSFNTQDFPMPMNLGFIELEAPMIPLATQPAPTPPPGTTPPPAGTTECTPTPPRGRPLLNIWPLATNGADCTDYPLLMVKNVTKGGDFVNGQTINATAGDSLRVRLYVHNGVLDFPDNIAKNVKVKAAIATTQITATAWADNADLITSAQKGGDINVAMPAGSSLSYVAGSATLYDRGPSNARPLSDDVAGAGANIGDMRGCFPFLHFITFDVKVNGPAVTPPPVSPPPVTPPPVTPPPVTPPPVTPPPPTPGFISLTKNVRDITQGQTTFVPSISANPGDQVEFQMQVGASSGAVSNVTLSDTLPTRLNFVANSLTVDGAANGNNLGALSLGNFSNGQTKNVVIRATVAASNQFSDGTTTLTNLAHVTSNSNSASAQASVFVTIQTVTPPPPPPNPVLTLTKEVRNVNLGDAFSSSTSAQTGNTVEFRIKVRNNSNTTAFNVRVTDVLPAGLTYIPGTFQIDAASSGNLFSSSQYLSSMSGGQTLTMSFQASVTANNGTLVNTAQALADKTFSTQAQALVFVTPAPGNVDLVLSKRAFNQTKGVNATAIAAVANDVITYTLRVENHGSAAANNFQFQDDLASVLTFSQLQSFGDASFDQNNSRLTWPSVTVPANGSVEKSFSVKLNANASACADNFLTNSFGNTVSIRIAKVCGLVAPPTGSNTVVMSFILAATVAGGFWTVRKSNLSLLSKLIAFNKNV